MKSQFSCFPHVWMFCLRKSNSLVNDVHERGLERIVYDDHDSSYSKRQLANNTVFISIH